ncbi:hypothetical protein ACLOJK_014958, partial [Asimina triloba]
PTKVDLGREGWEADLVKVAAYRRGFGHLGREADRAARSGHLDGASGQGRKNAEKVGRTGEDGHRSTEIDKNDGDGGRKRLRQTEKK